MAKPETKGRPCWRCDGSGWHKYVHGVDPGITMHQAIHNPHPARFPRVCETCKGKGRLDG